MDALKSFVAAALIAGVIGLLVPPAMYALHSEPESEVTAERPRLASTSNPAASAATPPPPPEGAVVVSLLDSLKLEVSKTSAPAGAMTFRAENKGAIVHELAVFKTDTSPESIPIAAGRADESKIQVVGRTKNLSSKGYEDLRLNLSPGNHILVCNIPGHFQAGMRMAFTVQ
jgi:uncharacterized cupredoxin-like copper-binding protein